MKTDFIPFVAQTAKDYDMPYHEVLRIYNQNGGMMFYEKLEEYIIQRSKQNENPKVKS